MSDMIFDKEALEQAIAAAEAQARRLNKREVLVRKAGSSGKAQKIIGWAAFFFVFLVLCMLGSYALWL